MSASFPASQSKPAWKLRYASHLGFRSLDKPLFRQSVGSIDPVAHIEFAAALGFSGVQDPWFATRPKQDQGRIAAALADAGLDAGCIVCGSPESIRLPLWVRDDPAGLADLRETLEIALDATIRVGGRRIAVLSGTKPGTARERQVAAMTKNLAWAAARAADKGITLCLEPVNAKTLPGMLFSHFDEAVTLVREIANPSIRVIFDTAHIQAMDGDLLNRLSQNWDLIEVIQIANHPGRFEPSCGEINMVTILGAIFAQRYEGLVELEHLWSEETAAKEQSGIDWLRQVDAAL